MSRVGETGPARFRTGSAGLREYIEGVILTIGGQLQSIVAEKEERQEYVVPVPNVQGPQQYQGMIPVFVAQAEPVVSPKLLPAFRIRLDDISLALERWNSYQIDQRVPAVKAKKVSLVEPDGTVHEGYSHYEERDHPWPFDLMFSISCVARYQHEALEMVQHVLRRIQPRDWIEVIDSNKERRACDAFFESLTPLSIVMDIEQRTAGWEIAYRVEALIDATEPYIVRAMTGSQTGLHKAPPFPVGG